LEFDRLITGWHRSNEMSMRLDEAPGVGPVLATAVVATVADPKVFRSGRNFSAWMSASLIGRLGSSTFRLSTTAVSMSLTGSCFSSESAPRPFHHGIRGRGGTIYWSALPSVER
jgi:hypothetical protein